MKKIKIRDKWVGDGEPCFIIAEAGSNHNGNMDQAKKLIDIAADAGADAVKFQTFRADLMYPKKSGAVEYLKKLGINKSIYDTIKEMEMPYEWIEKLAQYCRQKNIIFMSTPFDEKSVDILDEFVPAFKIASYEMTHTPLVEHIARKGKPIFISTGAADITEVREMIKAVQKTGNEELCIMQCTAKYPAPFESINLNVIKTLKREFDLAVGLSDHSRNPLIVPLTAIGVGANAIEKHFTISNQMPGPDHSFALEPEELKKMVEYIRLAEMALGSGEKKLHKEETELVHYRRAVYTRKPIKKGEIFTADKIIVLRKSGVTEPGVQPRKITAILGKKASKDLPEEHLLQEEDILW